MVVRLYENKNELRQKIRFKSQSKINPARDNRRVLKKCFSFLIIGMIKINDKVVNSDLEFNNICSLHNFSHMNILLTVRIKMK